MTLDPMLPLSEYFQLRFIAVYLFFIADAYMSDP